MMGYIIAAITLLCCSIYAYTLRKKLSDGKSKCDIPNKIGTTDVETYITDILDKIPISVIIKDVQNDLRYILWNKHSEVLSGKKKENTIGKTDFEIFGKENGEEIRKVDMEIVKTGNTYINQESFKVGKTKSYSNVYKCLINKGGNKWILSARYDISDLKVEKDSLGEENKNLHLAFLTGNISPIIWDIEKDNIKMTIPECKEKGNRIVENNKGITLSTFISHLHPNERDEVLKKFIDLKKGICNSFSDIIRYDINSQYDKYYEICFLLNKEEKDKVSNIAVGSIKDITQQKSFENEMIENNEKVQQSDRLKSYFLANMSHEIRTPLNAILGFTELLSTSDNMEDKKDYSAVVKRNNELLLHLINDILDLSKIEAGILDFVFSEVDVNNLISDIARCFRLKIESNQNISIVSKPQLESCIIFTERNRLQQVLSNFVTNAIKFTEKGIIEIGYQYKPNQLYFYVSDTGMGIPNEKKEEIFDRFSKLDNFKAGSGLGLSICKLIVTKLNGKIGVETEQGTGSKFWFTLPCTLIERKPYSSVTENSSIGKQIITEPLKNKRNTILVAEDNLDNYKLYYALLSGKYTLIHACNGVEAVHLFRKSKPDIIFMDIKMPEMDGYQATAVIRKIDNKIPIVAVTAFAANKDKQRILASGFNDYIPKPISHNSLTEAIRTLNKFNL